MGDTIPSPWDADNSSSSDSAAGAVAEARARLSPDVSEVAPFPPIESPVWS